jgi:autotransporter translocation and assembly factor TamB
MRVEIGGEVEIVKDGAEFEVFGTINVIRGHYELYGKRFTIKDGTLTFSGGEEINPGLDIDAEYVFRTPSREKKRLSLAISGQALSPVLEFSLDGQMLSEGDALSYVVFGRSLNQLTSGQRTAMASEEKSRSDMAKGAIANLLAGRLSETLGKEFNLDVIEIDAQSDWKSASFVVGKYLTTDLFVSYQRGLGTARDQDELVPEIVTLEYELSRHIFLQLVAADARNSGFDVIVKFSR